MAPSGECLGGYKPTAADCRRLAPSCGSFLPAVLNPVVIPGLRAGTWCAVMRGSLLIVSKCVCHLCDKELLYFLLLPAYKLNTTFPVAGSSPMEQSAVRRHISSNVR